MTDYTKTTVFTTKDALATGESLKLLRGSEFDTEFDAIATASSTKYDSGNIASEAQAEAGTLDTVLMTPLQNRNVDQDNAGMAFDIQQLADPGFDTLLGWDETTNEVIGYTFGDGIETNGTAVQLSTALDGAGLSYASGILSITDVAATTTNPIDISSSAFSFDAEALTTIAGSALAPTDTFYVEDAGVSKGIEVQSLGLRINARGTTSDGLVLTDMNAILTYTGTATLTCPNSSLSIGAPCIIQNGHASQFVTIALAASAELESVFHPGSAASVSDRVSPGGTALLYQTASGKWKLSGDIVT